MDENEAHQSFFELAKSYKTAQKSIYIDSEDEDDDPFWDAQSLTRENETTFGTSSNISENSFHSAEIKQAKAKSVLLSSQIEKDAVKTKTNQLLFVWIFLVIALISGSFAIMILTQSKLKIQSKISRSNGLTKDNSYHMPLFLYVPGTSASVIPSALSSCLGLKEARLGDDIENADYITASSICNIPKKTENKRNIRLFVLLQNPILRIPLSYIEMKDPSSIFYDPRLNDLSFDNYLANNSLFEKDLLTKRLICRQRDNMSKLTQHDLERAKEVLNSGEIGLFNDYHDSLVQFKNAFYEWDFSSSPVVDECMREKFKSESKRMEELYKKHGIEFRGYINKLKESSEFDMKLYIFAVYSKMSIT